MFFIRKFLGAEQDDLFVHLQQAAVEDGRVSTFPPGTDVKTILDTWTTQAGHPLVRVSVHSVHGDVLISQVFGTLLNVLSRSKIACHITSIYICILKAID